MIIQGSPDWYAIRLGRVTASRVADLMAKTKTGWGASRANYAAQLIAERLTGTVADSYQSPAMLHGSETEALAKAAYEFHTDADVAEIGFVVHPAIASAGASPDGLVGDDGMVEIKSPNTATHIDTLLGQSVPGKYLTQMQFQMACTGRAWVDFVSFDPRMPESMRLFVKRIERDEGRIVELEREVATFLHEIDAKVSELRKRYETQEAA
jgi:putative phage-type endonuclease